VTAPTLDSPCDGPVTYPGDTKILVKSSKGRSGPTLNSTTRLKNEFKFNIVKVGPHTNLLTELGWEYWLLINISKN